MKTALLDHPAATLSHTATLPSRPAKDTCGCQIHLPGSHPHRTFQQDFSAVIIEYLCQTLFPSRKCVIPGKTLEWLLLDFSASLFSTLPKPGSLTHFLFRALAIYSLNVSHPLWKPGLRKEKESPWKYEIRGWQSLCIALFAE